MPTTVPPAPPPTKVTRQADHKNGLVGHRGWIDGPVEWNRESRLEAESVQGVDDLEVFTIRFVGCAIWIRQVEPAACIVPVVRDSEIVAWERTGLRVGKVEQRMYLAVTPIDPVLACD